MHLDVSYYAKISSTCFEQTIFHHQEVCTNSLEYFILLLYKESCRSYVMYDI